MGESTVLFMQKGLPVSYERMTEESRTGWVAFDGEGIEGILSYFRAAPFSYQNDSSVKELRRACIRAVEKKASSEALSALVYELMLAYFRALNQTEESAPLAAAKAFMELAEDKNSIFLVAEKAGEIIGGCGLTHILDEGDIHNVMVAPAYRGQGIATRMLEKLLGEGRNQGICEFTLEVRVSNAPAIRVYEKLGFVSEGIRPKFYEQPVEDALIMWKR